MFSTRTIAVIGALVMVTSTVALAQGRHPPKKEAEEDEDADSDTEQDTAKARAKAKAKAKEKDKARAKDKAKAKARDEEEEEDEQETAKERAKAKEREREKAKEREKPKSRERDADGEDDGEADKDRARLKAKAKAVESEAEKETESAPAAGGEAYHDGTLGFSIPFTVIGGAIGGGGGEPVPTVDIVYFLDDSSALDVIVGLNVHRKQTVAAAGGAATTTNLIGVAGGLGYRMYSMKKSLRSFLEPQVVLSWPDTSTSSTLGVNLGGVFGLERNLTPWFSISGAVGAALNLTNSFKDIQLATTANLAANLYWH